LSFLIFPETGKIKNQPALRGLFGISDNAGLLLNKVNSISNSIKSLQDKVFPGLRISVVKRPERRTQA
jgi:hypothetical protein